MPPPEGPRNTKNANHRHRKAAKNNTGETEDMAPLADKSPKIATTDHTADLAEKQSKPQPARTVKQDLDNLFEMIRQQRLKLVRGPQITFYIGEIAVHGVPKRAAMAASSVLNDYFTKNPAELTYHCSDTVSPKAVRVLLVSWMKETCKVFEAYPVPEQKTFAQSVAVIRAARSLGMERYTEPLLADHVHYVSACLPSYEEIIIIEQSAVSSKDPLVTAMVNHLCHDRYEGLIPDPKKFAAFLEKHPILKSAMAYTDHYWRSCARSKKQKRAVQDGGVAKPQDEESGGTESDWRRVGLGNKAAISAW